MRRISAHLLAALNALAPSQPGSFPLSPFAPELPPASAVAASTAVALAGQFDLHGTVAPDNSRHPASFQEEVVGGRAEPDSTLLHVDEDPDVTRLLRLAEPGRCRAAASEQHEDFPLDDHEARLLAARVRRRAEPRQRRSASSQERAEDLPVDDYEARLLASGIANPGGAEHLERNRL